MESNPQNGLSLTEVLAATSLLVIVTFAAAQSTIALVDRQRVTSFTTELQHLAHLSRHHALVSSQRVTLCPLSDTGDCVNDWSATLSAFRDPGNRRKLDAETDLLKTLVVPGSIHLEWSGMGGGKALHFNGRGLTAVSNGTFLITSRTTGEQRRIIINRQGRVRVER